MLAKITEIIIVLCTYMSISPIWYLVLYVHIIILSTPDHMYTCLSLLFTLWWSINLFSVFQENASVKKGGEGVFKFAQPSLALSHPRPCSLPASLPHSPLTQQQHHPHQNHTPSPSSALIKQISYPLVCHRHYYTLV